MKFRFGYASEDGWRKDVEISNLKQLKELSERCQRYVVGFYNDRRKEFEGNYDGEIIVYNDYIE